LVTPGKFAHDEVATSPLPNPFDASPFARPRWRALTEMEKVQRIMHLL
jgi:hypothetical protein